MSLEGTLAERRELRHQRLALVPSERARDPDVVEVALSVEQPQEETADVSAGTVLVPPEARDDAVGGALVLDLEHRPLARQVRALEPFRDDAVEARALEAVEPVRRQRAIPGRGREVDRRLGVRERDLEPRASLALRD